MSSDSEFFRKLFERNQRVPDEDNNLDHFSEWLDDQDESLQEFVDHEEKEKSRKKFHERLKKKKKN